MKCNTVISAIVLCFMLSACANKPKVDNFREQFFTQINDDGSKWFKYKLVVVRDLNNQVSQFVDNELQGDSRQNTAVKTKNKKSKFKKQKPNRKNKVFNEEKYQLLLDDYLASNPYCKKGYLLLEESLMSGYKAWGECNESASDEDRSQWLNNPHFETE